MLINKKKGFTLTEVILFLSLAAIIIAIIFITYKKVSSSSKINREANNVNNIVSAINSAAATTSNYEFLRNGTFIVNSHILPEQQMISSNGSSSYFYNSWGGVSNITLGNYGSKDSSAISTSYTIQETNVPADVCPKFVVSVSGSAKLIYVGTMNIGKGVLDTLNNKTLSIEDLAQYCNIDNGNPVMVQLIYF